MYNQLRWNQLSVVDNDCNSCIGLLASPRDPIFPDCTPISIPWFVASLFIRFLLMQVAITC